MAKNPDIIKALSRLSALATEPSTVLGLALCSVRSLATAETQAC